MTMRFSYLDHPYQEDLHTSSLTAATTAAAPALLGLGCNPEWNPSLLLTSATQEVGFQWPANAEDLLPSPSASCITKNKGDLHDQYSFNSSGTASTATELSNNKEDHHAEEKVCFRALASDFNQMSAAAGLLREPSSLASMVSETTMANSEYLSPHLSPFSGPYSMDLHMRLLSSFRLSRGFIQAEMPALLRDNIPYSPCDLSEPDQEPPYNNHKMPSLDCGATEAMRSAGGDSIQERNYKASQSASNKRPRFDHRSSFSPYKKVKEKLGDRIAALQQLVAPFGKTDTASVLMEAIGYIKFLQDQIETLSVPYLRSSGNEGTKATQEEPKEEDKIKTEKKLDLRSRGLCLVPLACTSYVTSLHGVGVEGWSPPHYQTFG